MNCPRCNHTLRDDALFCDECGASLVKTEVDAASLANTEIGSADPLIGKVIGEKYQLLALLGQGGMGAVYRGRRLHIGDDVAIKVLHKEYVDEEQTAERFRREAQAAAKLRHPSVVAIYDFSEARGDEPAYIVMELVEGKTLRRILEEEGSLEERRAVELIREVCKGVSVAHRLGAVHRDIKPDNIMILPPDVDDGRERVKVVDFGIAKLRDMAASKTLTQTGRVIGTVYYMSPEQCCAEQLDTRSDVYSLGAVLFELLAGTPPFTAETATGIIAKHLSQPPPALPPQAKASKEVEAVIRKALSKEAAGRQADAGALRDELGAAIGHPVTHNTAEYVFTRTVENEAGEKSLAEAATRIKDSTADGTPAKTSPFKAKWVVAALIVLLLLAGSAVLAGKFWRRPSPGPGPASNVGPWQVRQTLSTDSRVYAVAFDPADRLIATASSEGLREDREFISEIRVWDPVSGQMLNQTTEHSEGTLSIAFSPDGQTLVSVTGSGSARNRIGKVKLWDARTGALKWAVSAHSDYATSVAFSPDGKSVASGSRDHTVKLWDAATGGLLKTLQTPDEVNAIAFSPSGNLIAIAGKKGVELWDTDAGEVNQSLSGTSFSPSSVAFSPDGKLVASGDLSGQLTLWDVQSGAIKNTFHDHSDVIVTVAFSPDGKLLASGGYDSTAIVFDLEKGSKLTTLSDSDRVTSLAFSHDNHTLATGGWSKTVKLWNR
jgi:eukaryotic-like serine/threonine-protein kinase